MSQGSRQKSFILATAGHVDHGKTALVRALTGTDTDRLPEEKKRGITIDLGFAHLALPPYSLGIVDVPGHEDFVKNMVAGVGSIDLALLIVAADDLWMPQTEEHLQILQYLGVARGVVALTKADLIDDPTSAIASIRDKLRGSSLIEAPIIPTSTLTGQGLDRLKSALIEVLAQTPAPLDMAKPRLPIDRVFTLKGIGTVVTGTLTGGSLLRNQKIVVQPSHQAAHIRSIQTHNREIEQASPGSRIALNLPELSPAQKRATRLPATIARGDVVTIPGIGQPSRLLDVLLERSGRPFSTDRPLAHNTIVRIHHGSTAVAARLRLLDSDSIEPGQKAFARLSLDAPLFALAGDRFILRDWPEQHTLAGGVILWPGPGGQVNLHLLQARASATQDVRVYVATELAALGFSPRATLLAQSRFSSSQIATAADELLQQNKAVALAGDLIADCVFWKNLLEKIGQLVDAFHRDNPQRTGLPMAELAKLAQSDFPVAQILQTAANTGFVISDGLIRRAGHEPTLPPRLAPAARRILATLRARPLDPPAKKELAPDDLSIQALKFLAATGQVVEISLELVLAGEARQQAQEIIQNFIQQHGPATVSQLKTALGSSRRVMVPLLEYFDRMGLTRRNGDLRSLK